MDLKKRRSIKNKLKQNAGLSFCENFDIQCEAEGKNMASEQLYRQAKETAVI